MNDVVKHDRRIKRWLLVISVIAFVLALVSGAAIVSAWNSNQHELEAGTELAEMIDIACEDGDLREELGTACPKAEAVKEQEPTPVQLPLTGPEGPPGPAGPQGPQGRSIIGPVGPIGPRGSEGRSIVGPRGPGGVNGSDGANGANGANGEDGVDGQNPPCLTSPEGCQGSPGRGIQSVSITPDGELVVEFTDGTTRNLGSITGPQGPEGPAGPQGDAGAPGTPGPTCPEGFVGQEIEVVTTGTPPGTQKIFACIVQATQ